MVVTVKGAEIQNWQISRDKGVSITQPPGGNGRGVYICTEPLVPAWIRSRLTGDRTGFWELAMRA